MTCLRVSGLDDSVTTNETQETLAELAGCPSDFIKCSSIKSGRDRLGIIYVRCPLTAAVKLLECRGVQLGWSVVKLEVVDDKPIQCFKCLAPGHVFYNCPSNVERRNVCFNCGKTDHFVRECRNMACCPVCRDNGRPANHIVGSVNCPKIPPKLSDSRTVREK